MEKVKFIKTGDEFSKIANQLKQECVDYLTQVTKEKGTLEFNLEQENEYFCLCCEESNYGRIIYSTFYGASLIDDLSTDEVYTLALAVYNKLKG